MDPINPLKKVEKVDNAYVNIEKTEKDTKIEKLMKTEMMCGANSFSLGAKQNITTSVVMENEKTQIIVQFKENGPELLRIKTNDVQVGAECTPSLALKIAALQGDIETVRKLKELGIIIDPSVNAQDCIGQTELMNAVRNKQIPVVQALMEAGADYTICDESGETAWMLANRRGDLKLIKALIEGAGNKAIDIINAPACKKTGDTALIRAVKFENIELLHVLKAAGADMSLYNKEGYTAFMYAATSLSKKRLEILKALAEGLIASDNIKDIVNMQDTQTGYTPLMVAIKHGDKNSTLLSSLWREDGASMTVRDKEGYTPLMLAILHEHPDIAQDLIGSLNAAEKQECLNACHPHSGDTVFMMAVKAGQLGLVNKLLHEKQVDIHAINNKDGKTALMYALESGNKEIVKIINDKIETEKTLVELQIMKSEQEQATINSAVIRGDVTRVRELKDAGADIDLADAEGMTPLVRALLFHGPDSEMAKILIELGANEEDAIEYVRRRWVSHVWGIGDKPNTNNSTNNDSLVESQLKGKKIKLEGFYREPMTRILSDYVTEFFIKNKNSIDTLISKSAQHEIHECVLNSNLFKNDSRKIKEIVQSGKPFMILGGSAAEWEDRDGGHAVSIVLCKGELIICNRGFGKPTRGFYHDYNMETFEVERFSLPPGEITEELIDKLKQYYPSMGSFNCMIRELKLKRKGGYKQKEQEVGNCAWASTKGAFGVLCRAYADPHWGKVKENKTAGKGNELYKLFTSWIRTKTLHEYLQESTNPDPEILRAIKTKCERKSGLPEAKALLGIKGVFGKAGAQMKHFVTMHLPKRET